MGFSSCCTSRSYRRLLLAEKEVAEEVPLGMFRAAYSHDYRGGHAEELRASKKPQRWKVMHSPLAIKTKKSQKRKMAIHDECKPQKFLKWKSEREAQS